MKNLLRIILPIIIFISVPVVVRGLTLTPSTGTYLTGSSTTLTLRVAIPEVTPVPSIDGIRIYISVTGATVTNFVPATFTPSALGECPGGGFFTSSLACAGYAKATGTFSENEILGLLTVTWSSPGTATVTSTDNTIYIDNIEEQTYPFQGTLGSYTITSQITNTPSLTPTSIASPTPTGRLPESGILDNGAPIIIGLMVTSSGILLYKYSSKNYKFENE